MHLSLLVAALVTLLAGCRSSDDARSATKPAAVHGATEGSAAAHLATEQPGATNAAADKPAAGPPAAEKRAPKPPDDMDERMRHCPLALDGATTRVEDIAGGVRFTVTVPEATLAEVRRRAHHIVDFAARKTREGHSEFDGKGGGRMKNCPVVTDDVTIKAADVAGGAQLDVTTDAARIDQLRAETRERAKKFPFAGATITVAGS